MAYGYGRLSQANTHVIGSSISMTEQRQWRELAVTDHKDLPCN